MSIQGQFEQFYAKIKLTKNQTKDARTKYTEVCEVLHKRYYPNTKYGGNTKQLIGSYGQDTHIRPARDVDVIFIMPRRSFSQYGDMGLNGPSHLLQEVKKALKKKYPNVPINIDHKVVALMFAEPKHKVEVQPAWRIEGDDFKAPSTKGSVPWVTVRPLKRIRKIRESNSRTHKTKILIRIIKKWQEVKNVRLKSYQVEDAVLGFFGNQKVRDTRQTSVLVRGFFKSFHLNAKLDDPAKGSAKTAYNIAKKACQLELKGNVAEATKEWRKIFGSEFPA